jgi:23S rRNA (uracil1939-C5)-methyltransferase
LSLFLVREAYAAGAAEAPHILDLYCGVGVFGLCCVRGAAQDGEQPRLVGVESGRAAVAAAKRNAESMGVKANFFCERVGASLSRMKVGARHTVVVDPPRGGMEPNVPGWLANRPAPRLIYVSCDPATLARDLERFAQAGTFRPAQITPVDLFPQTFHVENVCLLTRT